MLQHVVEAPVGARAPPSHGASDGALVRPSHGTADGPSHGEADGALARPEGDELS